jgi:hypothetical protein
VNNSSCRILIFSRNALQPRHYSITRIASKGEKEDLGRRDRRIMRNQKASCGNSEFSVTHPSGSYAKREATAETAIRHDRPGHPLPPPTVR